MCMFFSKCLDSKGIQNFGTLKYGNQSDGVNSQCFLCVCVGTVVVFDFFLRLLNAHIWNVSEILKYLNVEFDCMP